MDREKYLIIGGSTKCGTTSLFNYFEFHPEVCSCVMKESRYFLESEYKLIAQQRNLSAYNSFGDLFPGCHSGKVRLEATPDYLYSATAANRIAEEIPEAKMVFILRKPAGRMVSWYKFARQLGLIGSEVTFGDYINMQTDKTDAPQHLRSLEQGRYSVYLEKVIACLGREKVMVCFYEDLECDPTTLCRAIAFFAGINPDYFNGYDFIVYNRSAAHRENIAVRIFKKIKRSLKPVKQRMPEGFRKMLKLAAHRFQSILAGNGPTPSKVNVEISNETETFLNNYYASEAKRIQAITGKNPPW